LDQQDTSDYSRLRFTVGGNANQRWDIGATATDFLIHTLKQQNDLLAERLNELEATVRELAARK
jgi:hypothetical protein